MSSITHSAEVLAGTTQLALRIEDSTDLVAFRGLAGFFADLRGDDFLAFSGLSAFSAAMLRFKASIKLTTLPEGGDDCALPALTVFAVFSALP